MQQQSARKICQRIAAPNLRAQQRENVSLEVSRIHGPTKDVSGFPEVAFELAESDLLVAQTLNPFFIDTVAFGLCSFLVFIGYSNSRFCLTM